MASFLRFLFLRFAINPIFYCFKCLLHYICHFMAFFGSFFPIFVPLFFIFVFYPFFVFAYFAEDDSVTCGSVLKLQSVADNVRLHSHEVKYGSGSGQQSVTGNSNSDDVNSHWQILGSAAQSCQRGQPVKCDSSIRLMHLQTRCFLHSHEFSAPLSRGMQEVSCFGKEGQQSDSGDHYKVVCSGDVWAQDEQIKLKHENTGNYLSISGQQFGRPISGQREVIAAPSAGYKSLWVAAEGVFIKA